MAAPVELLVALCLCEPRLVERFPALLAEPVIGGDRFGLHIGECEDQGGDEAGAVTPTLAIHDGWAIASAVTARANSEPHPDRSAR